MARISEDRAQVLHIHPERCARADEVNEWLAEAELTSAECFDVYAGLAYFGQSEDVTTIVVSVDTLDGLEFEFFGLAKRLKPGVTILIYGRAGAESKMEQALMVGATDRATPFNVRALIPRFNSEATNRSVVACEQVAENAADQSPSEPLQADEPSLTELIDHMFADHEVESSKTESETDEVAQGLDRNETTEVDDENDEMAEDVEDESSGPVQVPWLRHPNNVAGSKPQRTPPSRTDGHLPPRLHPVPIPRDLDNTPGGSSEIRESLLTPEELAALLGEEFTEFESKSLPKRDQR